MTITGLVQLPPFPGGRPETGPMQFGVDWPGVFIRGDNALVYAQLLEVVVKGLPDDMSINGLILTELMQVLRSCSVGDTGWPP